MLLKGVSKGYFRIIFLREKIGSKKELSKKIPARQQCD
jgi:hypothetical protein